MQIVDDKALLFAAPNPGLITSQIKKSAVVKDGMLVNWQLGEAAALARLGIPDVPSPMLRDYTYTGTLLPFEHQKDTSSFLSLHKRAFCFNEQGTGKTASAIWTADYLMDLGLVSRVLVLCPLSIMKSAWQQDLFKFAMHRSCGVAHGSAKTRRRVIESDVEFVVINFDGLGVVKDEVLNGGFDLVIVDEANAYKNAQTARWKVLNTLVQKLDPRLWMMTGTPAAQSPIDAYGLAKLVNPDGCPKYYGQFRDSVMQKVSTFKWVPKRHAHTVVHRVLQPAIRYERADCLDLPPVIHTEREAPLTDMQKSYYIMLKNQLLFESQGEEVSAVHAAARINKLLQISGGAVYTDDGNVLEFDVSNRLSVVLEAIAEASHKVLVFVPFTHTIELLSDRLTKEGISHAVMDGNVTPNKRANIVTTFQTEPNPQVLIIQPQAAAHGLTLTAADTIIWYAPVTSVETYLQANARINRPGQEHHMNIIHIKGSAVEDRLYTMLQGHIDDHQRVIDLYRDIFEGK